MPTDVDNLRTRISAALTDELVRQAYKRGEYSHRYTPLDAEGNDLPELVGLDASIDPAVVADAVIEALSLSIEYENGRIIYKTRPPACKPNPHWKQRIVGEFEPVTD